MTEVYFYLYCVENSLRLFIQNVSKQKLGDEYFQKLKLNKDIQTKISQRMKEEQEIRWLRVRGDSEIFYLDLDDLGSIIQNNWELFSLYFPDMPWVMSKMSEFSKCRNLVAHNSYLEKHEKDVVRVNYTSILK